MTNHDCPSCGRTFDSKRGLGVHHSSVHGERLPNRKCDHCSDQFHSEYEKRYCSGECRDAAVSFSGADNPNYTDAKEETTCDNCGATFEYYPSEKEGCFCSECVKDAEWRHTRQISGPDNPNWNGGKLRFDCSVCETAVERYPSDVTGEVILCSRNCHAEWLSEAFTGDGHPNWRGGGVGEYGPGWRTVREQALERDGHACVLCGTDADELGRNPDVHHIVPVRLFAAMPALTVRDAHTLDNVVSLCPGCHRRAEFGRVSPAELRWRAGIRQFDVPAADATRA
ncbi:HNH endonuclease [Haloarcula sp. S1AR25-5A]|uniref:HNH endonuclease n=1 Tax=Haloarcula terrestris TaxID=2950533 RepID=A0AAE4JHN9_9EURY|nr:HNH endonuclease [Haloarcula terrestris]MDS0220281.1 HNH endonuclease [Haloarcula terrestris]